METKYRQEGLDIVVSLENISKSFDNTEYLLFEDVNFDLVRGNCTALMGDNGAGKTTLMRIIAGLETGDDGTLSVSTGAVISYLPQLNEDDGECSIREFIAEVIPELHPVAVKQSEIERNFVSCDDDDKRDELEAELEDLEYEFNFLEGWRVNQVLAELDLEEYSLGTPIKELSGGQRTRLGLARAFLAEPDLLLLDEPTNCIDIDARVWLYAKLKRFRGAVLIITHDRYLLDHIVAEMLEIDTGTHTISSFRGNYQKYLRFKKEDHARKLAAYNNEEEQLKTIGKQKSKASVEIHHYGKRKDRDKLTYGGKGERVQKGRAKAIRRLIRDIENLESNRTVVPAKPVEVTFELDHSESLTGFALNFQGIQKSFGDMPILRNCSASVSFGELVAIIGSNGAGKSTLLKILAGEIEYDSGNIWFGTGEIGYLDQEFEHFDREKTVANWIMQYSIGKTEACTRLAQVGFNVNEILPMQIMTLSYGQQRKLQLLDLIIRGCNILLLDEPTNHMDLHTVEEFESVILEFPGAVIAITHDQYFIEKVADTVLRLNEGELIPENIKD